MTGLAIGCVLSGLDAPLLMAPSAVLAAVLSPGVSRLYAGQALADMPAYDTMVAPENFTSTAGAITGVTVAFTGDAVSATAPLAEGDVAGFTVVATDIEGNERAFPAGTTTVEYKVRVTVAPGNEADIEINDLVPDSEPISIVIDGGAYAGTYDTLTAGDLRNGPAHFPGTISISHPGAAADLDPGDVLTADAGLWTTPTGTLDLTYQWQADGMVIGGATGPALTLTAGLQGTEVTVGVTGDDQVHAPLTVQSAAVGVPAGVSPLALARVGDFQISNAIVSSLPFTLDLTGCAAGTTIYVFYGINSRPTGMTLNGTAMTLVQHSGPDNGYVTSCYSCVLPEAGTSGAALSLTLTASANQHIIDVWAVTGAHTVASAGAYSATGLSLGVTPTGAQNAVLGVSLGRYQVVSVAWGGLAEVDDAVVSAAHGTCATLANAPAGSPTTATITKTTNDRSGLVLLAFSAA